MKSVLKNRREAGRILADSLTKYKRWHDAMVLALPRGGVIVGDEIAHRLELPLDICVIRKLGVPGQPELAMGAIAPGGIVVLNEDLIRSCGITELEVERELAEERVVLRAREDRYRHGRPPLVLSGKIVILVDDGIATGATVEAALRAIRAQKPARLILATGVASRHALHRLTPLVDEVSCALTPEPLYSISEWYEDFRQVEDAEVVDALNAHLNPASTA